MTDGSLAGENSFKGFHYKQHSRKDHRWTNPTTKVFRTAAAQSTTKWAAVGRDREQTLPIFVGGMKAVKNTSATEKDPEFKTDSCWIDCWLTFTEQRNASHCRQKVTWSWTEGNVFLALRLQQVVPNLSQTKVGSGSGRVVALAWHDGEGGQSPDWFSSFFKFVQWLQSHEFVWTFFLYIKKRLKVEYKLYLAVALVSLFYGSFCDVNRALFFLFLGCGLAQLLQHTLFMTTTLHYSEGQQSNTCVI